MHSLFFSIVVNACCILIIRPLLYVSDWLVVVVVHSSLYWIRILQLQGWRHTGLLFCYGWMDNDSVGLFFLLLLMAGVVLFSCAGELFMLLLLREEAGIESSIGPVNRTGVLWLCYLVGGDTNWMDGYPFNREEDIHHIPCVG